MCGPALWRHVCAVVVFKGWVTGLLAVELQACFVDSGGQAMGCTPQPQPSSPAGACAVVSMPAGAATPLCLLPVPCSCHAALPVSWEERSPEPGRSAPGVPGLPPQVPGGVWLVRTLRPQPPPSLAWLTLGIPGPSVQVRVLPAPDSPTDHASQGSQSHAVKRDPGECGQLCSDVHAAWRRGWCRCALPGTRWAPHMATCAATALF